MVALVQGITMNLLGIMAASSRRLCLPYRISLTYIFKEFSVPLEGKIFKELLYTDTYDEWSLHHIGTLRLVVGGCTKYLDKRQTQTPIGRL